MVLDIQNNTILLSDTENNITDIVKSQLIFWNFKNHGDKYIASLSNELFEKIINYCLKENIPITLSPNANLHQEKVNHTIINLDKIRQLGKDFKSGKIDKKHFDLFEKFINRNIKRQLKPHQIKSAYHLYLLGNAANFSVPGSGKTSVVLSVFEKLRAENKVNTLFVVGPISSFGPWKVEFQETLNRIPKTVNINGGNKRQRQNLYYTNPESSAELYLISFQTLLSDQKNVSYFLTQKHINAFFVVDEAHYIKQLKGNWANAILQLSRKSVYRCILTGTPMPKSYTDIFNLFDFLWPHYPPISSSDKVRIKYNEEIGNTKTAKEILDRDIGPLFYRVRKSDLNLKDQNFIDPYFVKMQKHEKFIYDAIFTRIKYFSQKDYFKNIDFINEVGRGRIIRLRQAVSYPKLLITAITNYNENLLTDLDNIKSIIKNYDNLEVPGKLIELIKRVKILRMQNLKVVVWSNFIETIKLIEKHLTNAGYYCKKIYGETPIEGNNLKQEETREKIRDEFVSESSGLDILIANPAACAESISLHKTCHHAIYYDLSYNCAQYLQSLDRIHRVGGSEMVSANYHFLQYQNTIDTDIKDNLDRKTKKMFDIVEEEFPIYSLDMSDSESDSDAYKRIFFDNNSTFNNDRN